MCSFGHALMSLARRGPAHRSARWLAGGRLYLLDV